MKRGRAKREDDEVEDEVPAPKKARGKKAAPKEIEKDDTDESDESELPKAKRAKKAAPKKEIDEDDAADVEPKPSKSKRGKKATVPDSSEKPVPQKRYEISNPFLFANLEQARPDGPDAAQWQHARAQTLHFNACETVQGRKLLFGSN